MQVGETEDDTSSEMKDLNEFTNLLLNGQRVADETKKTYTFMWRGYKACISSQLPKLSPHEIKRRFNLAIKFINQEKDAASDAEEELTQIPETQFDMGGMYVCSFVQV